MKTKLLFPHRFKRIGWLLLVPATVLGILYLFFDFEPNFLKVNVFAIYATGEFLSGSSKLFQMVGNNITDEIEEKKPKMNLSPKHVLNRWFGPLMSIM